MTKRKPTPEQITRIARVYITGKSDLSKRHKAGKLILFFFDNYRCSYKRIKQKAKVNYWSYFNLMGVRGATAL